MPEINEIKIGKEIGMGKGANSRGKFIYLKCELCGNPRWVTLTRSKKPQFKNYCMENGCQQRARSIREHAKDPLYWDGKSPLVVGMKFSAVELKRMGYDYTDKYNAMMVWHECPECKVRYWKEDKRRTNNLCEDCSRKHNGLNNVKEKSGRWSGGVSE
jgi:ribosomal protein S27E